VRRSNTANLLPAPTRQGPCLRERQASEMRIARRPFGEAFEPPPSIAQPNPSTVISGDSSTITATAISPQNRPFDVVATASTFGTVNGTGTTAALSTTGAAVGTPVTVTANVADDKGQTASNATSVDGLVQPTPPKPLTRSLCSIHFERDAARPVFAWIRSQGLPG